LSRRNNERRRADQPMSEASSVTRRFDTPSVFAVFQTDGNGVVISTGALMSLTLSRYYTPRQRQENGYGSNAELI
jgi:hypothetical protein